jgi:hypothetical protein
VLTGCGDRGGDTADDASATSAPTLTVDPPPVEPTTPSPDTEMPIGSVPPVLVGAWCGGSDAMGHATWVFSPDGSFMADETVPLSGVAQVNGGVLTLYTNEVGVQERTIAMDRDTLIGDVLYLDNYSYVRGEC